MPHEPVWIQKSGTPLATAGFRQAIAGRLYCTVTSVPTGSSEKNLCGAPVACLCGNIQCRHLIAARQSVSVGTCIEQNAQVVLLSKPSGKHHHGEVPVFFHVAAKRLR